MSRKRIRREDSYGPISLMAQAEGWVMVRRKGAIPFTMSQKEWDSLQPYEPKQPASPEAHSLRDSGGL